MRFVPDAGKNYEHKEEITVENSQKQRITRFSAVLIAVAVLVSAVAGGLIGYSIVSKQINDLQNQVSTLQEQLANLQSVQNGTHQNVT